MRRGVPRDMTTPLKIAVFSCVMVSAKLMRDSAENSPAIFMRGGDGNPHDVLVPNSRDQPSCVEAAYDRAECPGRSGQFGNSISNGAKSWEVPFMVLMWRG